MKIKPIFQQPRRKNLFLPQIRLLFIAVIISLSVILATGAIAPVWGQLPAQPLLRLPFLPSLSNKIFQVGDIEYTNVYLDGLPLFRVAAKASATPNPISPAERRAQTIENILDGVVENLVAAEVTPDAITLTTGELNNQTVIGIAPIGDIPEIIILSVTKLDAQIAKQRIANLTREWVAKLRLRLTAAWSARQPEARLHQSLGALKTGGISIVASLIINLIQRILITQYNTRKQLLQAQQQQMTGNVSDKNSAKHLAASPNKVIAWGRKWFNQQQQQNLNRLLRNLLQWSQGAIWLVGVSWILYQFPETRRLSLWLSSIPLQILIIWLVINLSKNITHSLIDHQAQIWINQAVSQQKFSRISLRVPTLAEVIKKLVNALTLLMGIIWFLAWQQISFSSILTGAGLFGVALSLVFQNLIKDWVNGVFIVMEDQYAIGDTINVGGASGLVEAMDLRTTSLRGEGGRLSTIPHSQIGTVHNLTKDWSQAEITVILPRNADVAQAMQAIKETSAQMQQDSKWQNDLLAPTTAMGITQIDTAGIHLKISLKTKRMRQWDVAREFLYRLKQVFDEQNLEVNIL
ncbi:MAG TPA: mechanosensitive ion channel family protein [Xenococcaceae cyanobacterium]